MSYNIEIIRENKHKTSEWSGGTTTELYICPVGAIYDQRNFKWRISFKRRFNSKFDLP